MDQTQLDILNLMARLDNEAPFPNDETGSLNTAGFNSIEDAAAVFKSTLAMRESIKAQTSSEQIPEAWIERIQSFSDEPNNQYGLSLSSLFGAWLRTTRDSILGHPQYWGAGLVTAGAMAIMLTPFGGGIDGPGLGGGIQGPALPGGAGGTTATSANLLTEASQESGPENAQSLSELASKAEIKGLSVPIEESNRNSKDCSSDLETDPTKTQEFDLPEPCLKQAQGE